jgi:2'-5' RNA ligase
LDQTVIRGTRNAQAFYRTRNSPGGGLSLSLLRGGLPGARWLSVENYHITLRFIGDIDGPTADELIGAFDRIDRQAFSLSLSGMGSFGSKKPHSIWAGVSPSAELKALQAEIERICQRLGLPPDPRRFRRT